jgi:hypothetical protein
MAFKSATEAGGVVGCHANLVVYGTSKRDDIKYFFIGACWRRRSVATNVYLSWFTDFILQVSAPAAPNR